MTIQKSTFFIAGFISLGMLACNSDNGTESTMSQSSSASAVAAPVVAAPATPVSQVNAQPSGTVVHPPTKLGKLMNLSGPANFSASGSGLNPAHGMPGHNCDVAVGAPLPAGPVAQSGPIASAIPASSSGSVKLNPAHGQPGHDCAVAVGAPLGSGTAATPSNALNSLTASKPTVASTPNFNANLKNINPAHGMPGHDCAVAVGAPLPAKGAAAKATASPAASISTPASAPAATTPNFGLPANLGKVNPAHGQPGHDCAVAVGAPLPG